MLTAQPRPRAALLLAAAIAFAAPLAGLALAGRPVAPYLDFPPRTPPVAHAPFSWTALALLSLPALAALLLFAFSILRTKPAAKALQKRPFPAWGWAGVALVAAGWLAAWTEGLVPAEWRRQTFSVLWLGYIVAVNGLVVRRGGEAPLVRRTGWFLALFPASAALWWLFEYLNQFAANWHYAGIAPRGALAYFLQATLPFATVLPALASTQAWLQTFPRMKGLTFIALPGHPALAWIAFLVGVASLAALPLWPELLFPMLWMAPALVLGALHRAYFFPLARGDWRGILQPAAAALVCGFLWELWNWGSLAKWHYSIPYVQRFELFEMPLLGYAGYLPFGVACALVMDALARRLRGSSYDPGPMSELNDPRVLFAAERTLMAWSRTAAGLMAFGFLIDRSELLLAEAGAAGAWLALAFLLLGVALSALSIVQYRRALATLRPAEIPPGYWVNLSVWSSAIIGLLGLALALYLVIS